MNKIQCDRNVCFSFIQKMYAQFNVPSYSCAFSRFSFDCIEYQEWEAVLSNKPNQSDAGYIRLATCIVTDHAKATPSVQLCNPLIFIRVPAGHTVLWRGSASGSVYKYRYRQVKQVSCICTSTSITSYDQQILIFLTAEVHHLEIKCFRKSRPRVLCNFSSSQIVEISANTSVNYE